MLLVVNRAFARTIVLCERNMSMSPKEALTLFERGAPVLLSTGAYLKTSSDGFAICGYAANGKDVKYFSRLYRRREVNPQDAPWEIIPQNNRVYFEQPDYFEIPYLAQSEGVCICHAGKKELFSLFFPGMWK